MSDSIPNDEITPVEQAMELINATPPQRQAVMAFGWAIPLEPGQQRLINQVLDLLSTELIKSRAETAALALQLATGRTKPIGPAKNHPHAA